MLIICISTLTLSESREFPIIASVTPLGHLSQKSADKVFLQELECLRFQCENVHTEGELNKVDLQAVSWKFAREDGGAFLLEFGTSDNLERLYAKRSHPF